MTNLRLAYARVLTELGELGLAEAEAAALLDEKPDDLDALTLLAKVKHMRGELSLAVGCWATLHARTGQDAATQLRAILNLAMAPQRGAGDFVLLGSGEMARKPAAQLELEEAFIAFLQRRVDDARARCERLARKHHRGDRSVYKLAVLAGAWLAELTGDLDSAARLLEDLGRERGFELDVDRLVALARVYERLGGNERLAAAAKLEEHLYAATGRLSVLGRLAALQRRLGREQAARETGERFYRAFRSRMHRPSLAEVVLVASAIYLPLPALAALPWRRADDTEPPSPRARALRAALTGDPAAARPLLAAGGEPLDIKYLADLDGLAGDGDAAMRGYLRALAADPVDLRVAGWLLERVLTTGEAPLAEALRNDAIAEPLRDALEERIRLVPLDPAPWRHLAALLALLGAPGAAEALAHGDTLEQARRRAERPIGRARAAAAYTFVGRTKGIIHELWAGRDPAPSGQGGSLPRAQIHGNLGAEMTRAIQGTFLSVREYARSKFPHLTRDLDEYSYHYKLTKEDEPSYGLSAGLPTAIAFLSVFLQRPVPQDLALTGTLVADAHDVLTVRPVGDGEHKLRGAYNCNLRMLIMPSGNRAELRASPQVPLEVEEELVRYVADLDDAVRLVFGAEVFFAAGVPTHAAAAAASSSQ